MSAFDYEYKEKETLSFTQTTVKEAKELFYLYI